LFGIHYHLSAYTEWSITVNTWLFLSSMETPSNLRQWGAIIPANYTVGKDAPAQRSLWWAPRLRYCMMQVCAVLAADDHANCTGGRAFDSSLS
jgi:hypothetical protein